MTQLSVKLAFERHWFPPDAGLGTIVDSLGNDIRLLSNAGTLRKKYDARFQDRYDYRLWRLIGAKMGGLTDISSGWGTPYETVENGLAATNGKHVWGLMAVLAVSLARHAAMTQWKGSADGKRWFSEHEGSDLAVIANRRLGSLPLVSGFEAECAAVGCLLLDSVQHFRYNSTGVPMSLDDAKQYVGSLIGLLEQISYPASGNLREASGPPRWEPGWSPLSFYEIRSQREKRNDSIAPFDGYDFAMRLRAPFYNVRGILREAVICSRRYDSELLLQAYLFAMSAWRYARSLNRGHEQWLKHKYRLGHDEMTKRAQFVVSQLEELRSLMRATQAAYDLADVLGCARLSYLLLSQVPDFVQSAARLEDVVPGWNDAGCEQDEWHLGERFTKLVKEIRGYPRTVSWTVRQAGLEVDSRFYVPSLGKDLASNAAAAVVTVVNSSSPPQSQSPQPMNVDPIGLLVGPDYEADSRWAAILKYYPQSVQRPLNPLRDLNRDLKDDIVKLQPGQEMHDSFGICLKYGFVATAGRILKAMLDPSLAELADMAHSMKRASQVMPVGIEPQRYAKWCRILRDRLVSLPIGEGGWHALSGEDAARLLVLHEVLIGRGLSIIRGSNDATAHVLVAKHYGSLADSQLRELLDSTRVAGARGCATVTPEALWEWIESASTVTRLGCPACISVVALTDNELGILALLKGRQALYCRWQCDESVGLLVERVTAYLSDYVDEPANGLAWPESLLAMCRHICDQVPPGTRWCLVAAAPELAVLPWQLLYQNVAEEMVVSLVPNLGWATMSRRRELRFTRGVTERLSMASSLDGMRTRLTSSSDRLAQTLGSVGVVLGHGVKLPEAPTICVADKPLWIEEWLEMAKHRTCIVHSCSAAKGESQFLGDIGGVPALLLGGNTLCFMAPVSEVSVEVAEKLHDALVEADGPAETGLRYLTAVRSCPPVGLYNLYGLANDMPVDGKAALSDELWSRTIPTRYVAGQILTGRVVHMRKYGAFIELAENVQGLLHVSEYADQGDKAADLLVKVGQAVTVRILSVEPAEQKIALSMKLGMDASRQSDPLPGNAASIDDLWLRIVPERYTAGQILKGRIVNIVDYGAFVELAENVRGLLHVSEYADQPNGPAAELVKVGQEVDVKILWVKPKERKIALSMNLDEEAPHQPEPLQGKVAGINDLWLRTVPERYLPGQVVKGRVVNVVAYGAFVELEENVSGLLHVSEYADQGTTPGSECIQIGHEVHVKILWVKPEERKIALSMKLGQEASQQQK